MGFADLSASARRAPNEGGNICPNHVLCFSHVNEDQPRVARSISFVLNLSHYRSAGLRPEPRCYPMLSLLVISPQVASRTRTDCYLATSYFHLPVDEEQDKDIASYRRKYITWTAEPSITSTKASSTSASPISPSKSEECIAKSERNRTVNQILSQDDLYEVLGVQKSPNLDKIALRRAYLSRSRECHPEYVNTYLVQYTDMNDITTVNSPSIRQMPLSLSKKSQWHTMYSVNHQPSGCTTLVPPPPHTTSSPPALLGMPTRHFEASL